MDLVSLVGRHAGSTPDKVALWYEGEPTTFAQLDARSDAVAAALAAGTRPGERVAYLGRSHPRYFEFLLGSVKAGTVLTPLNWRLAPAELVSIIRDAGVRVIVADREFWEPLARVAPTDLGLRVTIGDGTNEPAWDHLAAQRPVRAGVNASDIVLQIYTSGTTGRPKGVMTSSGSLATYLNTLATVAGIHGESVTASTMPQFHIGGTGWVLAGLARGATSVLLTGSHPGQVLAAVEEYAVTNLIAVPTIIRMILAWPGLDQCDLSQLETLYYGGGPISPTELKTALGHLKCQFVQGFGMTECGIVLSLTSEDHRTRPDLLGSCGRPVAATEVRVVDPGSGLDVPDGTTGELWVRSPIVMAGYWNQPEATAAALSDSGWLRTGDAVERDSEGYLYIRDRLKDMIISGGENVYSAEVENALMTHPLVLECAVIGVPSQKWTETVKAVVVAAPGVSLTEAALIGHCRESLASYKCPTSVAFVEALPRNLSGKVLKHVLRGEHASAG